MSFQPLDPVALLDVLRECGVDFVLIGGHAVNVYAAEIRPTADVDIMVPAGDPANKKALEKALLELGADMIPLDEGGIQQPDAEYPTVMFRTRYGKLDVLYRPDGSAAYREVRRRAAARPIGGGPISIASKDDLVAMKAAGGRQRDLEDIGSITRAEQGESREIRLSMALAPTADPTWARDLARGRAEMFDPDCRVWIEEGSLIVSAARGDLTDDQMKLWATYLAERLLGSEVLEHADIDVQITRKGA